MAWDQEQVLRAARVAAQAHLGQTMILSETPYLLHCTQVAMETAWAVAEAPSLDGTLAIVCAMLQDTVEDTSLTVAEIEAAFGSRVAAGVASLTKQVDLPKAEATADSLNRIRRQPTEVWCVKLADRIVNLQPPPESWKPARCSRYADEAGLILESLGDASAMLAERLGAKIANYREQYCAHREG